MMAKQGIDAGRVTPAFVLHMTEPFEAVYAHCEDELLLTIAKYFAQGGGDESSAAWQIRTLANLGKFSRESARIIARYAGYADGMAQIAVEQTMLRVVGTVEPELKKAYAAGLLEQAPVVEESQSMKNAMQMYAGQAVDRLNLVNTVMLNSSLEQYRKGVANTLAYEQQLAEAQSALNARTGEVITGQTSWNAAKGKAVRDMARAGLTGFVDRAGRRWSPEAYVSMDIRTTLSNTAHAAVDARMQDYGAKFFQVSEHAGARPLCYPYQGKYYSTDGTSGTARDLNGQEIRYEPLGVTSYGEPAGLFGINCGHYKIPFIPGYSVARKRDPEPKAENDAQYQAMQRQRQLEREVRAAKREATCLDAVGDKEGFRTAAMQVKSRQARLNAFTRENGLTKRDDRTQVLGYNKSVSGKVTTSVRAQEAEEKVAKAAADNARAEKISSIRETIRSDATPKAINVGHQNKHILGSPGYMDGRSYIFGDLKTAQALVDQYHGTGEIRLRDNGDWSGKEFVTMDYDIGVYRNADGSEQSPTNVFAIHYGKKGTHVVPARRKEHD